MKEISDMRDETDLNGLKLTIDLKRGQDPDKLMQKAVPHHPAGGLVRLQLQCAGGGQPGVMGVAEILTEWTAFRTECVRRRTYYDLQGKKKRLHLLKGLEAILLDIDKAIRIVRETSEEAEVVPNLMIGFGIDQAQAEYVAEIKLRHLQPGIYPQAHPGNRRAGKGDCEAGGDPGLERQDPPHHYGRAGRRGQEIRPAAALPPFCTRPPRPRRKPRRTQCRITR